MEYFGKKLHTKGTHLFWENNKLFFYLADTQWYGLTGRCTEAEFERILRDRKKKGFTAIQLVVGIPPETDIFSENAKSTHGIHVFDKKFKVRQSYFADIKRKIELVIKYEMVPVLYGSWGPYIDIVGTKSMIDLWKNIVTNFSQYPVIYCLCGEVDLIKKPKNLSLIQKITNKISILRLLGSLLIRLRTKKRKHNQIHKWQKVADHLVSLNKENHPITVHIQSQRLATDIFPNNTFISIDSMQSGHSLDGIKIMEENFLRMKNKKRPYINLEPLYEGILEQFDTRLQNHAFYKSIFAGAIGHSYGAHGLWQMAKGDNFMSHWGNSEWKNAMKLPGGIALGRAKRVIMKQKILWYKIQEQPDAVSVTYRTPQKISHLTGKVGKTLIVYIPEPHQIAKIRWTYTILSLVVYNAMTFEELYNGTSMKSALDTVTSDFQLLIIAKIT